MGGKIEGGGIMGDKLRVRMFIGINVSDLESKINSWLECHEDAKISMVKQSVNGGRIIISIWYFDEPKEDTGD